MDGESLWPRLAGLSLVIEACEYDRLHAVLAYEFERITTHVRLVGAGVDGLGEDVSVFREDGTALHETRPSLPLEGQRVGLCRAGIDAANLVDDTGGVEKPLGESCLTGVYMCQDAQVERSLRQASYPSRS